MSCGARPSTVCLYLVFTPCVQLFFCDRTVIEKLEYAVTRTVSCVAP